MNKYFVPKRTIVCKFNDNFSEPNTQTDTIEMGRFIQLYMYYMINVQDMIK